MSAPLLFIQRVLETPNNEPIRAADKDDFNMRIKMTMIIITMNYQPDLELMILYECGLL